MILRHAALFAEFKGEYYGHAGDEKARVLCLLSITYSAALRNDINLVETMEELRSWCEREM